jgi:hypothetical protein
MNGRSFRKGMNMLQEVRSLREIVRRCRTGEPFDAELSRWLATSLQNFLDHRCSTTDDAFGLHAPKGGVPWWLEEAMRERNASLRQLAETSHPERSVSCQARLIRLAAVRYAATGWLLDRSRAEMPPAYRGTSKEWLWRAFKSGAPMPIGERQLRKILAR